MRNRIKGLIGGVLLGLMQHGVAFDGAARWHAAWLAPHSDAFLSVSARDQTLRQVVSVHATGQVMRVKLSNRLGAKPVTLGAASVGVSLGQAVLAAGAVRPLLFDGRQGVTLAAGESRYSDPVALPVRALDRVAISLHVSGTMWSGSRHFTGNEQVWVADGEQVTNADGRGYRAERNPLKASAVLIESVEVQSPQQERVLVAFGDSITDGFIADPAVKIWSDPKVLGTNSRYPDFLQRRLLTAGDLRFSVVNAGISGNRLLSGPALPFYGEAGLSRFDRDVLNVAGVTDVLVLIGINDLGNAIFPTWVVQRLKSGLSELVARARSAGVRIHVGTLLPTAGSTGFLHGRSSVDSARRQVNQWIRTELDAHSVVDFDACLRDPTNPKRLRPVFDSGDHLHPGRAGYLAMAECVSHDVLK